jgi:hypothetical protein
MDACDDYIKDIINQWEQRKGKEREKISYSNCFAYRRENKGRVSKVLALLGRDGVGGGGRRGGAGRAAGRQWCSRRPPEGSSPGRCCSVV